MREWFGESDENDRTHVRSPPNRDHTCDPLGCATVPEHIHFLLSLNAVPAMAS